MKLQAVFRVSIRIVFLFAFVAFLSASISHVAMFFHNFEADKDNWIGPYMLAVSIDLTALVLTVGVMFFRKDMPWYAVLITWIFIFALTFFSWVVNWEYASTYQGDALKVNGLLSILNPILASSFAFFNLVYSFVSEFFSMKVQTADELQKELERLEAMETVQQKLNAYRDRNRKKSLIQVAKETVIEAKDALNEVRSNEQVEDTNNADEISPEAIVEEAINPPAEDEVPVVEEPLPEVNDPVQTDVLNGSQTAFSDDVLEVLEAYPLIASEWLSRNKKSVTLDEIITVTGHGKRRLNRVAFARSSRNKELILVSSVLEWLKTAPKPEPKAVNTDEMESVSPRNGHRKNTTPLPDLAEMEV